MKVAIVGRALSAVGIALLVASIWKSWSGWLILLGIVVAAYGAAWVSNEKQARQEAAKGVVSLK